MAVIIYFISLPGTNFLVYSKEVFVIEVGPKLVFHFSGFVFFEVDLGADLKLVKSCEFGHFELLEFELLAAIVF